LKSLLPFTLTLLFLALLFYLVPVGELLSSLKDVKSEDFFIAFVLYSLSQFVRSIRWKLLLKSLSLHEVFLINSANILFNNLLPARTGELSWFYYAKRLGVNMSMSLWSFFVGRFYDLLSLFLLLFLSLSAVSPYALLVSALLLLLSLCIPWAYLSLPSGGRLGDLRSFLRRELSLGLSFALLFLSFLSQGFKFLSLLVLLPLGGADLYRSFLAFLGGELSSVLPLHSFMGFGTYEFAFGLPLRLLGESLREWLKLGFLFHSFLLLSSFLWGVPSALFLSRQKPKS